MGDSGAIPPGRVLWVLKALALGVLTTLGVVAYAVAFWYADGSAAVGIEARYGNVYVHAVRSDSALAMREGFGAFDAPPVGRSSVYDPRAETPYWSYTRQWNGPLDSKQVQTRVYIELGYGWPMRAMKGLLREDLGPGGAWGSCTAESGILLPAKLVRKGNGIFATERVLPVRPIVLGFLVDTAIFAAGWLAVLRIVEAARRAVRSRAGRCVACGYDRAGLPKGTPCPECGCAPTFSTSTP